MSNFVDDLKEEAKKNRTFDRNKAIEQIIDQAVIAVCDELITEYKKDYGDYSYSTKFDSEPISKIKKQCIARMFKVDPSTISGINIGANWAWL